MRFHFFLFMPSAGNKHAVLVECCVVSEKTRYTMVQLPCQLKTGVVCDFKQLILVRTTRTVVTSQRTTELRGKMLNLDMSKP